jgi:thiamine-phosphate pyrophosphorylase
VSVRLVALTDLERFPDPVAALGRLCGLARPGGVAIVLRDKDAGYQTRLALGQNLRRITREAGQQLLVADRVDLGLELEADGVHLPTDGLLPSEVARLFPGALLSRAHHDALELPESELARLDILLISPAFAVRKGRPALGARGVEARSRALRGRAAGARLLALGGVEAGNVAQALAAGADGVAAIGAAHQAVQQDGLVAALGIARE